VILHYLMDISEFLKIDSSRLNADMVVDKMEEDPDQFDVVWKLVLRDEYPLSMRASRAIWLFAKKHPYFLEHYIPELIGSLQKLTSEGVIKNILNIMGFLDIPKIYLGELFDICLSVAESPSEPVASRANAMTVMYNISNKEPELKPELIAILDAQIPAESAGIEARAHLLLEKLYKEI
jgi:hypothetical protein